MTATSPYLNQSLRSEAEYLEQRAPVAVPEPVYCPTCRGTGRVWACGVAYSWSRKSGYETECLYCNGTGELS